MQIFHIFYLSPTSRCVVLNANCSYGVVVWEILTREIPCHGKKYAEILNEILGGKLTLPIPETCPPVLCDIIKGQLKILDLCYKIKKIII